MPSTACRHAEGTISSSSVLDVWRMASEDSDQLLSGFAMVHRLSELGDLDQPFAGQVPIRLHDVHAVCELLEVQSLRGPQRMPTKERNDHFNEIAPPSDDVLKQVLLVVVASLVL